MLGKCVDAADVATCQKLKTFSIKKPTNRQQHGRSKWYGSVTGNMYRHLKENKSFLKLCDLPLALHVYS